MIIKKPNKSENKRILASNMWALFNFDNPNSRYQKFLSRGRPAFKSFIESIMLYDEVVVPTQDFMSLSILLGVLGERAVLDLLHADILKFARVKGAFSYVGNGGGIKSYMVYKHDKVEMSPFCAPVDEALAWSIKGLNEKPKDPNIDKLVLEATFEFNASNLEEKIRHETYMDVLNSEYLRNRFALRNKDMDNLTGIQSDQLRIYGGPDADSWKGDEIDTVMLLSNVNLELFLMCTGGYDDLATVSPVGHLLKAKKERCLKDFQPATSFMHLKEIAGIPDVGEAVLGKSIKMEKLVKIRDSKNGVAFRKWFHEHCRGDIKAIAKEYIGLLKQEPVISAMPARIVRYILTTIIGVASFANPVVGGVVSHSVSAVDSFFLDRCLQGSSPKFFIEDLKQVSENTM